MYTDVISHCHYSNYIQITTSSFNRLHCTEFGSFSELGLQRSLKLPPLISCSAYSKIYSEDFSPKLTVISKTLKHTNKAYLPILKQGGDRNATEACGSSDVAVNCQKPSSMSMELFSITAAVSQIWVWARCQSGHWRFCPAFYGRQVSRRISETSKGAPKYLFKGCACIM